MSEVYRRHAPCCIAPEGQRYVAAAARQHITFEDATSHGKDARNECEPFVFPERHEHLQAPNPRQSVADNPLRRAHSASPSDTFPLYWRPGRKFAFCIPGSHHATRTTDQDRERNSYMIV